MIVRKREFVELLEELAELIRNNDSFEGNISYTCMKEGLPEGCFDLEGGFRYGNSMGQGGMAIFPPSEENKNEKA